MTSKALIHQKACEVCGGKGTVRYEQDHLAADGTVDGHTSGTRPCKCVRDLPAIHGSASWWGLETIYSEIVAVPIGNECIEVTADCEVPRNDGGRRLHRTAENAYYPPMVNLLFPGPSAIFHAEDARKFAAALNAAADACDKADELAMQTVQEGGYGDV